MITSINTKEELEAAILHLKSKEQAQKELLLTQINNAVESIRPVNLLKNTLHKVSESPAIKSDLINIVTGLGAGLISKKIIAGKSTSILRNILGTAVEMGVINFAAKNSNSIKALGSLLLSKIINKFRGKDKGEQDKSDEDKEEDE